MDRQPMMQGSTEYSQLRAMTLQTFEDSLDAQVRILGITKEFDNLYMFEYAE